MQRLDVLFFIEHVARELDIACAVRHLAQRDYGLNVEISALTSVPKANMLPRVVAVPYFYSRDDFGTRDVLRRFSGIPFVNLAFEQILFEANKRFKRPKDRVARRHVTHLAAGEFFRRYLCSEGVPGKNIVTTGSLPCALYEPTYRAYFDAGREQLSREHGLDATKPWVFFPENFGAAFFKKSQLRRRARRGFNRHALRAYRDFARQSFREIMTWCGDAGGLGTVELIIRPRPATPLRSFVDAFHDVTGQPRSANLHFIKAKTVREWVMACDVVVSSFSTTLVEAAVAEKPAYLVAPFPIPDCLQTDWFDVARQINTKQAFLDTISNPDHVSHDGALRHWARANLLPCGDPIGNLTAALAAICAADRGEFPTPPVPSLMRRVKCIVADGSRTMERSIRATLRRQSLRESRSHENDIIRRSDILRRTRRWADVLGSNEPNARRVA